MKVDVKRKEVKPHEAGVTLLNREELKAKISALQGQGPGSYAEQSNTGNAGVKSPVVEPERRRSETLHRQGSSSKDLETPTPKVVKDRDNQRLLADTSSSDEEEVPKPPKKRKPGRFTFE